MRRWTRRICLLALVLACAGRLCDAFAAEPLRCWPVPPPRPPLAECFARSEVTLLVRLVKQEIAQDAPDKVQTVVEVGSVLRALGTEKWLPGQRITLPGRYIFWDERPGLLFGVRSKDKTIDWSPPVGIAEADVAYVVNAPHSDAPISARIDYFAQWLECDEPTVAEDAYTEIARLPIEHLRTSARVMPRARLREWLNSEDVPPTRLHLYGLLLGLRNDPADARLMAAKIATNSKELRLGIDGVMAGYLMLTGEKGLAVIEKAKFLDKNAPFAETYSAMQALRFMWTNGEGKIADERLKSSMRLLLNNPDLADLVILDLAQWKDWSQQERLVKIYNTDRYNSRSTRRAIVRYLIASTRDIPAIASTKQPEHVVNGKRCLEKLRQRDPVLIAEVEKTFVLQ